ncbi:hypothetical protein I4U23_005443 [Adineta vaga]|nr:hypothetical protein I4U23_005443 [Adineta vaga]
MFPPLFELINCNDLYNLLNAEINGLARISDRNYLYLLDCRSEKDYNESHIITAEHIKRNQNGEFQFSYNVNLETREHIILYDNRSNTLPLSEQDDIYTCTHLLSKYAGGLTTIKIINGGYELFSKSYPFLRTQQIFYSPKELELIETYPNEICPQLIYLGRREHALNSKIIKDLKIRAYINCTKHNDYLVQETNILEYYQVPIDDKPNISNVNELFHDAVSFIAIAYNRKYPVLIYSDNGISRSAAIAIAFISFHMRLDSQKAFEYVEDRRIIRPQQSFLICIDELNEKFQALKETLSHRIVESEEKISNENFTTIENNPPTSSSEDKNRKKHQVFMEILGIPTDQLLSSEMNCSIEKEESENILEQISIKKRGQEWLQIRRNDLVYEDHLNSSFTKMIEEENYSYEKLLIACRKYEQNDDIDIHKQSSEKNFDFFIKKNLSEDDARAVAFAIAFYTGSKSNETIKRSASLVARTSNGEIFQNFNGKNWKEAIIILYYLAKGLANIPYYWGVSTRSINLTDAALKFYKIGSLITWLQFSSSRKGYEPWKYFSNRNTYFIIYSLTGRCIKQFSIFPEEDEILFLPHSIFLVLDHKINDENQHMIYLRQVELGFCERSILWIDDHIFDSEWENKSHMERASTRSLNFNVHFIPKSSSKNALSFLRSSFGQRLKNRSTFRIVTDMRRDNELSPELAGIQLIKQVRQLGFQNDCLIFTYQKKYGLEKVENNLTKYESKNVFVADDKDSLDHFVGFE